MLLNFDKNPDIKLNKVFEPKGYKRFFGGFKMKLKVFFVMGCMFSASLFAQSESLSRVVSLEILEQAREHSIKMDIAYTSLLSSLRKGDLTGALSANDAYFDLLGIEDMCPLFANFISSSLTEVKNCSEAYRALNFVLFEKGAEFMNSKITRLVDGRELELSFYNLRKDIINAVSSNYLNLMNGTCSKDEYEANLVKLNETRTANLFDNASTALSVSMIDQFFADNSIKKYVNVK
jgi:hypothetical protein